MKSTWREHAAPIIARIIRANPHESYVQLRKRISKAYPFRERECHPYKIWRDEVKRQLTAHFGTTEKQEPIDELPLFGGEA